MSLVKPEKREKLQLMKGDRQDQRHTFVQDNRTAAEILADLQREMAEMGLDLVPRDDSSFALPRVLPATGVTPPGSESDGPE